MINDQQFAEIKQAHLDTLSEHLQSKAFADVVAGAVLKALANEFSFAIYPRRGVLDAIQTGTEAAMTKVAMKKND